MRPRNRTRFRPARPTTRNFPTTRQSGARRVRTSSTIPARERLKTKVVWRCALGPEREIQERSTLRRSTVGPRGVAWSTARGESVLLVAVDAGRTLPAVRRGV